MAIPDSVLRIREWWRKATEWVEQHKRWSIGGAIVLIFGVAFDAWIGGVVLSALKLLAHSIGWLASQPLGLAGTFILATVLVLLLWSFVETSSLAKAIIQRLRGRADDAKLLEAEAKLAAFSDALRYGPLRLMNPAPLNNLELGFLRKVVGELRNTVISAHLTLRVVLNAMLLEMLNKGDWTTEHHLALVVQDTRVKQANAAVERFQSRADAAALCDSREALAAAIDCYHKNRETLYLLARCTRQKVESLDGYLTWHECDSQFSAALNEQLSHPQLAAVQGWLYDSKRSADATP